MTAPREPAAEHSVDELELEPARAPRALALALGQLDELEAELGRLDDHDLEVLVIASRHAGHGIPAPVRPGDLEAFRQARRT